MTLTAELHDTDIDPLNGLCPEAREKTGATGSPVVLADGSTWLLCDGGLQNELDELRDKIYDDAHLTGEMPSLDIAMMAANLLIANYLITPTEAWGLIAGVGNQALADAVWLALFGPTGGRRTYTVWAATSLLANGIDPALIPSRLMPQVLDVLVATKRALPAGQFIESIEASRRRAAILNRITTAPPAPIPGDLAS